MSKLDEIKKALQAATPGPWKLVMDSYDDEKDTHFPWMIINAGGEEICDFSGGGDVKLENAHIMTNAPEWLRFLLDELDRKDEENRKLREQRDAYYKSAQFAEAAAHGIEKLREENRKMIEVLRWYAERYEMNGSALLLADLGQRARNILKEIGVRVE